MHQILVRPLITEKMTNLTADHSQYGFLVNPKSNKIGCFCESVITNSHCV